MKNLGTTLSFWVVLALWGCGFAGGPEEDEHRLVEGFSAGIVEMIRNQDLPALMDRFGPKVSVYQYPAFYFEETAPGYGGFAEGRGIVYGALFQAAALGRGVPSVSQALASVEPLPHLSDGRLSIGGVAENYSVLMYFRQDLTKSGSYTRLSSFNTHRILEKTP